MIFILEKRNTMILFLHDLIVLTPLINSVQFKFLLRLIADIESCKSSEEKYLYPLIVCYVRNMHDFRNFFRTREHLGNYKDIQTLKNIWIIFCFNLNINYTGYNRYILFY